MIAPTQNEEFDELLAECYNSTKLFCETFMPHVFYRPFSKIHDQIFELLDDESIQKIAIAAPRGIGKTSIVNKALPAKHILYRTKKYIVPISETSDVAIEQSENLKDELLTNEEATKVFGPISLRGDTFSKEQWITSGGTKVKPRGAGQQIRGRLHGYSRPDFFIGDDLENDESVESEDQRRKLKQWFLSAVINSVDRGSKDWRLVVIGTILHEDSLLSNLLRDSSWASIRLELCNDLYQSNWPKFMSDEKIAELVGEYREAGELDIFYREFRNIPVAVEERGFKPKYFQSYKETERELNNNEDVETVILSDPSKTHKKGNAKTAIVAVSVNIKTGNLYIRDIIDEQMYPDELYAEVFAMAERTNALILAPEVTGLNEYIMQPFLNAMSMANLHYIVIEVKPREGKTGPKRSAGLIPYYRGMNVWHRPNACGALESRLLQWPRPDRWDVIDAVSGIIYVMEEGERYFLPKETDGDIESEYRELESEYEESLNLVQMF